MCSLHPLCPLHAVNLLSELTQELTEKIYSVNLLSELTEEIYSLCLLCPLYSVNLLCEYTTTFSLCVMCSLHPLHPLHTVNLLSELTKPIWANLPCELTQELIEKIYSVNFTQ